MQSELLQLGAQSPAKLGNPTPEGVQPGIELARLMTRRERGDFALNLSEIALQQFALGRSETRRRQIDRVSGLQCKAQRVSRICYAIKACHAILDLRFDRDGSDMFDLDQRLGDRGSR